MTAKPELSQQHFDKLLNWLNKDRPHAAEKYESIRQRLIKIFVVRGSFQAEELADVVIERVTKKIFDIADSYQGDPSLYFYGVAQNVFLESLRVPKHEELPVSLTKNENINLDQESEKNLDCLETCLKELGKIEQKLILSYYQDEKRTKINNRKIIAEEYGISLEMLRIKAFRIREKLQKCLVKCVEKNNL